MAGDGVRLGRTDAGDPRDQQARRVVGSLDEIVLHQRCAGTPAATGGCQAAGPIADGVFHVLGATAMLVAGLMLLVQRWLLALGQVRAG